MEEYFWAPQTGGKVLRPMIWQNFSFEKLWLWDFCYDVNHFIYIHFFFAAKRKLHDFKNLFLSGRYSDVYKLSRSGHIPGVSPLFVQQKWRSSELEEYSWALQAGGKVLCPWFERYACEACSSRKHMQQKHVVSNDDDILTTWIIFFSFL